jgi:hypothetical protein
MKPSKTLLACALSLTFLFCICSNSRGQEITNAEQPNKVTSLNKLRVNLLGLGYEREQAIGRITTFYIGAGVEASLIYESEVRLEDVYYSGGDVTYNLYSDVNTEFKVYPSVNTGIRHYFNFERRIKKGKKTTNNAAGYVAFDVMAFFPVQESAVDYQINLGPMWGFQTNLGKRANFELCLGPSMAITNQETFYGIGGKLGFSFLF